MLFYFLMKSATLCSTNVDPLKIEVSYLKKLIGKEINANEENIILIANGGLCIQDGLLGSYNCADNEENPVFVYLRQHKGIGIDIIEDVELNGDFSNYKERLKMIINKTVNNLTILQENEILSVLILESSKRINKKMKLEIRNQFLLFDGWSAALANLSDSLSSVEKRIDAMKSNLDNFYSNSLDSGFAIMDKFNMSKAELENVPLLSVLFGDSNKVDENSQHPVNLLQWVLSQDSRTRPQVTVQSLISEAHEAYNELLGISEESEILLSSLKDKWGQLGLIATAFKNIDNGRTLIDQIKPMQTIIDEDCEEVERVTTKETYTSRKGFLKRLNYLEGVREQSDKLVNLIQTHKEYMEHTVRQCRESSSHAVLLDHCASAKSQLENVNKHYSQLREYLNQIERSKVDLTRNIDARKIWLQNFQTKICEVDDSLFLVKEKMKRVRTGLRVLDQMHNAPLIYVRGVAEIARRQHYLDFWYNWGIQCSKFSQIIRQRDQEARMLIEDDFENHFIQSLFSSLYSLSLPKIGIPLLQSTRPVLPIVSDADLEKLAEHMPQFHSILQFEKIDVNSPIINSLYTEPLSGEEPALKSIPIKISQNECFDGVSLLPIPDDTNMNIDELCISHRDQELINPNISHDSVSNSSSKMVKSIDSMDFQLTNDATTETKKDIVCVSRSVLESISRTIQELRLKLNTVKVDLKTDIDEQNLLYEQMQHLVTETCTLSQYIPLTTSVIEHVNQSVNTSTSDSRQASNTFQISHKEFTRGDPVCFVGSMVNGTLQWRMLSSDNRIYFLNDSNFSTPPVNRRFRRESNNDYRDLQFNDDSSTMSMSQSTPQTNLGSSAQTSMPIVKGIFVSKEEYMCKKTTNRYGLPINTKFFRVHANIEWVPGRSNN